MKRFRFRLERVLEWQEQQRQIQENLLKVLLRELEQADAAIAQVRTARTAADQQLLASKVFAPGDLVALAEYRQRAARQETSLRRARQESEQRLIKQRSLWQEAERKCRMLERLKERRRQEHEFEVDRELEAFASEMYLARWRPSDTGA